MKKEILISIAMMVLVLGAVSCAPVDTGPIDSDEIYADEIEEECEKDDELCLIMDDEIEIGELI